MPGDLEINAQVTSQIDYGHVFGGDVIESVYEKGREGDFGYIQKCTPGQN